MSKFLDDLGRIHAFGRPPARVVSLVPSDTFSVVALGARERIVGRTEYCVEPASLAETIPTLGGTKNVDVEAVIGLRPDLVLANQEENSKRDVDALVAAGLRVFVSFPRRVADGFSHLARLARLLGIEREPSARSLVRAGYDAEREASAALVGRPALRTFAPIWMDPLMTANGATFLSDALALCGAENVFADRERRFPLDADLGRAGAIAPEKVGERDTRYPRVTLDEVVARQPDLVLLSDEPHPFSQADAVVFGALPIPAARSGSIVFCSGKDLCWSGAWAVRGLTSLRAVVEAARARVARGAS